MKRPEENIQSTCTAVLESMALTERLKMELRHCWLSNGRNESVAEHTWNMAMLAMLVHPYLSVPVDIAKTLKMILVHDLPEAKAGDVPYFEKSSRNETKLERERVAMSEIGETLPGDAGTELGTLWQEFETGDSPEARFARALDHLEVQMQHNLADLSTWEAVEYDLVYTKMDRHCEHDIFLSQLCSAVRDQAEKKMLAAGVDIQEIKDRSKR